MSVDGRNITSFAENVKGAASRASVHQLSYARTINRKGVKSNDLQSNQVGDLILNSVNMSDCSYDEQEWTDEALGQNNRERLF